MRILRRPRTGVLSSFHITAGPATRLGGGALPGGPDSPPAFFEEISPDCPVACRSATLRTTHIERNRTTPEAANIIPQCTYQSLAAVPPMPPTPIGEIIIAVLYVITPYGFGKKIAAVRRGPGQWSVKE